MSFSPSLMDVKPGDAPLCSMTVLLATTLVGPGTGTVGEVTHRACHGPRRPAQSSLGTAFQATSAQRARRSLERGVQGRKGREMVEISRAGRAVRAAAALVERDGLLLAAGRASPTQQRPWGAPLCPYGPLLP